MKTQTTNLPGIELLVKYMVQLGAMYPPRFLN